jgi:regulator of nonsense transcripts 2
MQEYIRHLIFEVLSDGSIVEVLRKLMKLPWGEAEPYLLKCLLKVCSTLLSSMGFCCLCSAHG